MKNKPSVYSTAREQNSAGESQPGSEERFRNLLENIQEGYFEVDLAGNFTFFNDKVCRVLGYSSEELMGMNNRHYTDSKELERVFQAYNKVYLTGDPNKEFGWQIFRKDGVKRYIEGSISLSKDSSGRPSGFRGVVRDVTERKQMEEFLRQSEEKYRTVLENIEDGYYEVDLAGNFTFFNNSMCQILGYSKLEMMGMNNRLFTDKENAGKLYRVFNRVYKTGRPAKEFDWQIIRKNGAKRYIEASVSLLKDSSGNPNGFKGIVHDITERRKTEERLHAEERRFRTLTEQSSDIILLIDKEGRITYENPAANILGIDSRERVGASVFERIHSDDVQSVIEAYNVLFNDKNAPSQKAEVRLRHADGSWHTFETIGSSLVKNNVIEAVIINLRDITDRKKAEQNLFLIKKAVESSGDAIGLSDPEGHHFYHNKAFTDLFGYTVEELQTVGGGPSIYVDKDVGKTVFDTIKDGGSWSGETELISKSGNKFTVLLRADAIKDDSGKIIGLIGLHTDMTEIKKAERLIRESEEKYRLLADHMKDQIWLMDLDLKWKYISPSVEKLLGYNIDELQRLTLDKLITETSLETVLEFLSVEMPKAVAAPSSYTLKRLLEIECRCKDGRILWMESSFSFIRDENGNPLSILGEARNITERKLAEDELQRTLESLRKAVGTTIQVMISALEMKDPYTAGHQSRVADIARAIATEMNLDLERVDGIRMAGTIHDIGKLSIPSEILTKPTKLTNIEFAMIKEHSQNGYEMLKNVESPWPLAEIVRQHHERINGSGYPRKLKGDEILIEARILAVADVVEAMATHRPYRASLGIEAALEEIEKNKGILYDEAVAAACLKLFREKGYKLM